jgi:hypothetical protein
MAGKQTAPKKTDPINPDLVGAIEAGRANHAANIAAHKATQAALKKLQEKIDTAIAADPVASGLTKAGFELDAATMDRVMDMVAARNPKLAKLMKKEEKKSSDSDSDFLSNSEYMKAIKESGNEALIATAEFQGKMVHWKFWSHRNTRTLLIGVGAGVVLTIAIPKLIAWARSEDATDAEGDVVDFEVSDRLAS